MNGIDQPPRLHTVTAEQDGRAHFAQAYHVGRRGRPAPQAPALILTLLGLAASVVTLLIVQASAQEQLTADQFQSTNIVKSAEYYIAHAIQVSLLFFAGLLALSSGASRIIERGYLLRFGLLWAAAAAMALRGYSFSELLSTKLVDASGPFVFFISVLVFVAARRRNWIVLGKVMWLLAILFSGLALQAVVGLQTGSRHEAVVGVLSRLNVLFWPAAWLLLREYPRQSLARRLRLLPLAVYGFGSVFTQTRLNFVMLFALLGIYSYLQYRRKKPQAAVWIISIGIAVWISLCTAVFLVNTRGFEKLSDSAAALSARLDEDTRSSQLQSFAEDVKPSELIFGKGSFATWQWGRARWAGTDIGYLTLLFYGGLPLLLTYVATHVWPCFRALRANPGSLRLPAAGVVLLWGIRMFSSSYAGVNLEYYPVLFCVGACISRDFEDSGISNRMRRRRS